MKLESVIRDMTNVVIEQPSHRISHTLERGLQIDMKREGSVISAVISRGDTYPSQLEYDIVMGYFPDDWSCLGYEKVEQSNRYWLRAKVHIPLEVELGKPFYKLPK